VEAIATIAVLGVTGTVATGIIMTAVDGYLDASVSAQLHAELSVALDRCTREVRNIQLDDTVVTVAPDVDNVFPTAIRWDDNSIIGQSGTNLVLQINGGPPAVLVGDVVKFGIQAYDEANVALPSTLAGAACDPIRRFTIEIVASRNGRTQSLRSKLFIRSTMARAAP
jgi:hypothetical protein